MLILLIHINCIMCPNHTKLNTALPYAVNNGQCKDDKRNGCQDMPHTERQTYVFTQFTQSFFSYLLHPSIMVGKLKPHKVPCYPVKVLDNPFGLWFAKNRMLLHKNTMVLFNIKEKKNMHS